MEKTFSGKQRRKKEDLEMDITSLLDILVILLFFLLKSYNASELTIDVVNNLNVANSKASLLGEMAIIVQVDKDQNLYIRNTKLVSLREPASLQRFEERLAEEKESYKVKKEDGYPINLVLDKEIEYGLIKKIMHASAGQGFTKFKLIVEGD